MSGYQLRKSAAGFTLIELIVTLAIAAILLTMALPSFNSAVNRNRIVGQANDFIAATMLARTEAIRRNGVAGVCASNNNATPASATCTGNWSDGWIVWADADGDRVADAGEALRTGNFSARDTVTEVDSIVAVQFNQRGRRITPATGLPASGSVVLTIKPSDCRIGTTNMARTITLNSSGSASVSRPNCT